MIDFSLSLRYRIKVWDLSQGTVVNTYNGKGTSKTPLDCTEMFWFSDLHYYFECFFLSRRQITFSILSFYCDTRRYYTTFPSQTPSFSIRAFLIDNDIQIYNS